MVIYMGSRSTAQEHEQRYCRCNDGIHIQPCRTQDKEGQEGQQRCKRDNGVHPERKKRRRAYPHKPRHK